jgi:hypothetical protein
VVVRKRRLLLTLFCPRLEINTHVSAFFVVRYVVLCDATLKKNVRDHPLEGGKGILFPTIFRVSTTKLRDCKSLHYIIHHITIMVDDKADTQIKDTTNYTKGEDQYSSHIDLELEYDDNNKDGAVDETNLHEEGINDSGEVEQENDLDPNDSPWKDRFMDVVKTFAPLGWVAFGGPQAHVALLREQLVRSFVGVIVVVMICHDYQVVKHQNISFFY